MGSRALDMSYTTDGDPFISHVRRIDPGGTGDVHEMYDISMGKPFARKLIHLPFYEESIDIIQKDEVTLRTICDGSNPNVIQILRLGHFTFSDYYFIDMELCDMNLHDYLHPKSDLVQSVIRRLPDVTSIASHSRGFGIWDIMTQIASGLKFIHGHGAVHRDLKPCNVLYSLASSTWKLTDFGFTSEATSSTLRNTTSSRGTEGYRAPELAGGEKFSNKVDIWSMGCLLYEIATGEQAFRSDFAAMEFSYANAAFVVHFEHGIKGHSSISDAICRMLQVDPAKRPAARELQEEFWKYREEGLNERGSRVSDREDMEGIVMNERNNADGNTLTRAIISLPPLREIEKEVPQLPVTDPVCRTEQRGEANASMSSRAGLDSGKSMSNKIVNCTRCLLTRIGRFFTKLTSR